jgi:hypothetical protein
VGLAPLQKGKTYDMKKFKTGGRVGDPVTTPVYKPSTVEDFNRFKADIMNESSQLEKARLDYYNQRLDSTLYGNDYNKYRDLKNTMPGINQRINAADSIIRAGYDKSLSPEDVRNKLGTQYQDYIGIKTKYMDPNKIAGTGDLADPLRYGLRNSFGNPAPGYSRVSTVEDSKGNRRNIGEYDSKMSWRPDSGYELNAKIVKEYGLGGILNGIGDAVGGIPVVGGFAKLAFNLMGKGANEFEQVRLERQQREAQAQQMALSAQKAGQSGLLAGAQSKYLDTFPYGGMIPGQTPVELEKQEVYQTPDGQMGQVDGPSHAEGGIDMSLPGGTFVWSDKLKTSSGRTFADEAARLGKLKAKYEKMLNS